MTLGSSRSMAVASISVRTEKPHAFPSRTDADGYRRPGAHAVAVFRLFDEYLEWAQAQPVPSHLPVVQGVLQQFAKFLKLDRPAENLKRCDVLQSTARHPNCSSWYQTNAIREDFNRRSWRGLYAMRSRTGLLFGVAFEEN